MGDGERSSYRQLQDKTKAQPYSMAVAEVRKSDIPKIGNRAVKHSHCCASSTMHGPYYGGKENPVMAYG